MVLKVSAIPKSIIRSRNPRDWRCLSREELKEKYSIRPRQEFRK